MRFAYQYFIKFGADVPESYDVDMDTDYEDSDAVGQDGELQVEENKPDYHESFVGNDESLEMLRSEIAAKLTAVVEGQELFLKHDLTIAWVADKRPHMTLPESPLTKIVLCLPLYLNVMNHAGSIA